MPNCIDCGVEVSEEWRVFCPACYKREVDKRGGKKPVIYEGRIVPDDTWLWCLHCERFFQARDYAHRLGHGFGGSCPFCAAAGICHDVFFWDSWAEQNPGDIKHWPKSVAELSYGLVCPLYPEKDGS